MFTSQECIDSLKYLAKTSNYDGTYCQRLSLCSQEFDFRDYENFKKSLPKLPKDRFGKVSLRLMRRYCEKVEPNLDEAYYEFYAARNKQGIQLSFYSSWVGWDKNGREVRQPRPFGGKQSIEGIRNEHSNPVYVVENHKQLLAWLISWQGVAVIPDQLAREHFSERFSRRKRLVCKDVDLALVRSRKEDYGNNIAT